MGSCPNRWFCAIEGVSSSDRAVLHPQVRSFHMKKWRLKTLLLAASGMFAFQVAGCNILEQLKALFPGIGG
jgi:hypothetical protein